MFYVCNMNRVYEKITDFIRQQNLIETDDSILVSVSAGKDSVFLLHYLKSVQQKFNLQLNAFHLNHLTRGEESDKDMQFIKNLCVSLEIKLISESFDFSNIKNNFENTARNKRYEFLKKYKIENNINKIATAHTRSDDVETILYRIFRGTSIYGLQGISAKKDNYIRPLLCVDKEEIIGFLKSEHVPWREDESNQNNSYDRNYIRNEIIPLIEKRFNVNNSIENLKMTSTDAIDIIRQNTYNQIKFTTSENSIFIELCPVLFDQSIFKYFISDVIRKFLKIDVTNNMLEESYRNLLNSAEKSNLTLYSSEKIDIIKKFKSNKFILIIKQHKPYEIHYWEHCIDLEKSLPYNNCSGFFEIKAFMVDYETFCNDKESEAVFINCDNLNTLKIRQKNNGDKIESDGKMKRLKKLIINNKLDGTEKLLLPIVESDGIIISVIFNAVCSFSNRVSDAFKVDMNTKKILAIYCKSKIM